MRYFLFASLIVVVTSLKITPCENERLKTVCGKTNKGPGFKSYGGRKVRKDELPWLTIVKNNDQTEQIRFERRAEKTVLVRLQHNQKSLHALLNPSGMLCSGALISQRHVITAAHCVAKVYHVNKTECVGKKPSRILRIDVGNLKHYSVYVGSGCSHPEKCHKRRNVAKVTPHPLYKNHCVKKKDIAILELDKDINESEATPICVADQAIEVQNVLQAAGQGIDQSLKNSKSIFSVGADLKSELPTSAGCTVPTLKGDALAKGIQVVTLGFEFLVRKEGAIATRNATAGTAPGDSGGPLFQFKGNGQAVLLGPNSRKIYFYAEKITRDFFTDIREETKWVCDETGVCPGSTKLLAEELEKCKK